MLPLFRAWDVGVWNRRTGNQASRAPLTGVSRWFASDEADSAAAWATDIVFTTPVDAAHDSAWHHRVLRHAPRGLVHLGRRRKDSLDWGPLTTSFDLDHVFALAGDREQQRSRQLAAAALACATLVEERLAEPRLRACSV
jgi:hypothetical protein